jgi:hypothetical protein
MAETDQLFLFRGGPFYLLQRHVGLVDPWGDALARRAPLFALVAFVPLVVLAAFQGLALGPTPAQSVLRDRAVYARFLVALPLLLRAENLADQRFVLVQLPAFPPGDQVTGSEIAALGGDTLARLAAAADAYLRSHAADYPGFGTIVEVRWVKRVVP